MDIRYILFQLKWHNSNSNTVTQVIGLHNNKLDRFKGLLQFYHKERIKEIDSRLVLKRSIVEHRMLWFQDKDRQQQLLMTSKISINETIIWLSTATILFESRETIWQIITVMHAVHPPDKHEPIEILVWEPDNKLKH